MGRFNFAPFRKRMSQPWVARSVDARALRTSVLRRKSYNWLDARQLDGYYDRYVQSQRNAALIRRARFGKPFYR